MVHEMFEVAWQEALNGNPWVAIDFWQQFE